MKILADDRNYMYINPSDNRWKKIIDFHREATIFHHPAWLRLITESYGYRPFVVISQDENGNIRAGLPMMEIKRMFTRTRWVSVPFSDHCAPLSTDSSGIEQMVDRLTTLARKPGAPEIELRLVDPAQTRFQPSGEFVLHTIPLEAILENVERRFHQSHRRNIKIAQSNNVQIKVGRNLQDIQAFYALHLETRHRQGVPVQPYHFFELLHKLLIDQGLGFVLLAYVNQQCLAGAVFLHWKQTLTYKYGASKSDHLSLRPNHLIFWKAIEWGCEHGYTRLDLGRSSIDNVGLRDFKSRWGALETPLYYTNLTHQADQISNHRFRNFVQAVIKKSPIWVCRLSGEILYKYFG
jgi:CelD/BcsL family acetyltransferase involved in cellulose biosynthesis